MEYKYKDTCETTLEDFFIKYRDKLPCLVVVTGGVYGTSKFDDVASDQVMRFHRFIAQDRILARYTTSSCDVKLLSIPVDTDFKFQVVKRKGKLDPEDYLQKIIKHNKLPVLVQTKASLPSIQKPPGQQHVQLLITEEYKQYYIQGHCILDGRLTPNNVTTVIVIPDIYVSCVEGFVDATDDKFREHIKQLDKEVNSGAKFDDKDVSTEIRVVEATKADVQQGNRDSDSDREYEYIDPPRLPPRNKASDSAIGRPLPTIPSSNKNDIPALPPRDPSKASQGQSKLAKGPKPVKPYENEKVKRCTVNPIVKETTKTDMEYEMYDEGVTATIVTAKSNRTDVDITTGSTQDQNEGYDVSDKSISNIIDILKQLKLAKYVDVFENDMVDGMTLKSFTEDDLKKEYSMRHAEAVRLMNFVRRGHIPK